MSQMPNGLYVPRGAFRLAHDEAIHIPRTFLVVTLLEMVLFQLRVTTSQGVSDWSKLFDIPDSSWPIIVIIAVAMGAVVISVLLGGLGFYYYYKRHVKVTTQLRSQRSIWIVLVLDYFHEQTCLQSNH